MYINLSMCMLQMWCHTYFSRYSILKIHNNWKELCNSWCNYITLKKSDGAFPLTFKIFDLHKYIFRARRNQRTDFSGKSPNKRGRWSVHCYHYDII